MPRLWMLVCLGLMVCTSQVQAAYPTATLTHAPSYTQLTSTPTQTNTPLPAATLMVQTLTLQTIPNPVKLGSSLQFNFALPRAGKCSIEIFDLRGQRLAVLANGPAPTGPGQAVWRLDNRYRQPLAPGTYVVLLQLDNEKLIKKIVITP